MSDENTVYQFVSNGGCTRCDAMDGRLSSMNPMPRPHANCNCQIVDRDYGLGGDGTCDEGRMQYELLDVSAVHHGYGENPDDEFDLVHTFRVRCPDGETLEAEVVVSATYGQIVADMDGAFEDAFAEALELIEELAATECKTCPDPPAIV